jgi:micrococcal nuclease
LKRLILALLLALVQPLWAATQEALVLEVEDGDTLLVSMDEGRKRVQLIGIDAPEDKRNPKFKVDLERSGLAPDQLFALGEAATAHLKTLVKPGDQVTLNGNLTAPDRYGRIPAEVFTRNGLSLNVAMVSDGYARILVESGVPKGLHDRLFAVWELAQNQRRGLWAAQPEAFQAWLQANH